MTTLGPFCPIVKSRVKASYKVNEILFKNLRPSIVMGGNGTMSAYKPWKENYSRFADCEGWNSVAKQANTIFDDIDQCVEVNPNMYVGIVGYDEWNAVEVFQLVHTPAPVDPEV